MLIRSVPSVFDFFSRVMFTVLVFVWVNRQVKFVRMEGLEPPRLSAPDPKSGTATNYATCAHLSSNGLFPAEIGVSFFKEQQIYRLFDSRKELKPFLFVIFKCGTGSGSRT